MSNYEFGAGIWMFQQFVDRYATDAYGPPVSTLQAIAQPSRTFHRSRLVSRHCRAAHDAANEAGSPVVPSIVQCTGVPAFPPGNASIKVTPVAVPRPEFDTVTVNPIAVPDDTDAASAFLVT